MFRQAIVAYGKHWEDRGGVGRGKLVGGENSLNRKDETSRRGATRNRVFSIVVTRSKVYEEFLTPGAFMRKIPST